MKKMMLLASVVALAALMLAAAPAFAQDFPPPCNRDDVPPGLEDKCDNAEDNNDNDNDNDNDFDFVFCDFDDDGNDDGDDCEFNDNDRDRDIFRNIGNVDVSPNIDISQDIDQDADSGDISQPVSVTGGGDNSIQTVGVQPTANTGCAQNATGVLQAAPIVTGLGGDTVINNDDNGDNDGQFIRCDRDGDGNDDGDNCDDFDNDRVFCDRDGDGNDDGDDDCFVFVNDDNDNGDRDVFRNIGNDRVNINGPDFGDTEVDSNASIDMSPDQVVKGGGTINQAATASSTWVWIPGLGWRLM
jgi:hypothetical protein